MGKTLSNVSDVTIAYSVKIIQADKAAAYESKEWHSICAENGIQSNYASPTLHEDAAVAERVWETIQDAGRVLLYTAKFMKNEWPLAFSHAYYIYNRMPHPHLNNTMCPFEFATGIKPDLSKLRIFGCLAYAYIDPSRSKFRRMAEMPELFNKQRLLICGIHGGLSISLSN